MINLQGLALLWFVFVPDSSEVPELSLLCEVRCVSMWVPPGSPVSLTAQVNLGIWGYHSKLLLRMKRALDLLVFLEKRPFRFHHTGIILTSLTSMRW